MRDEVFHRDHNIVVDQDGLLTLISSQNLDFLQRGDIDARVGRQVELALLVELERRDDRNELRAAP